MNPYITVKSSSQHLSVSFPTAEACVKTLIKAGILKQYIKAKRNRIFVAHELVKILEKE